jgi:hypothetical protein
MAKCDCVEMKREFGIRHICAVMGFSPTSLRASLTLSAKQGRPAPCLPAPGHGPRSLKRHGST